MMPFLLCVYIHFWTDFCMCLSLLFHRMSDRRDDTFTTQQQQREEKKNSNINTRNSYNNNNNKDITMNKMMARYTKGSFQPFVHRRT